MTNSKKEKEHLGYANYMRSRSLISVKIILMIIRGARRRRSLEMIIRCTIIATILGGLGIFFSFYSCSNPLRNPNAHSSVIETTITPSSYSLDSKTPADIDDMDLWNKIKSINVSDGQLLNAFLQRIDKANNLRNKTIENNKKPCSHVIIKEKDNKETKTSHSITMAIHSQTLCSDNGDISGSEITTFYLAETFAEFKSINSIYRVGPGRYDPIYRYKFDIVIVEGYHQGIERELYYIRKNNPRVKIFFLNFSTSGLTQYLHAPFDVALTNSPITPILWQVTQRRVIVKEMELAAPDHVNCTFNPNLSYPVVFVGAYTTEKSEEEWELILGESLPFGLVIFGSGWDEAPEKYKKVYKGTLEFQDLFPLYASSTVVLGVTRTSQHVMGMINNRVFDALRCGAYMISTYQSHTEEIFGSTVFYSRQAGDTTRYLTQLLRNNESSEASQLSSPYSYPYQKNVAGQQLVTSQHLWSHRATSIMTIYRELLSPKVYITSKEKKNKERTMVK